MSVDAVVYYRIQNPMMSVCNIEDAANSTRLLSQTTLRNFLGMCTLTEILTDRDQISQRMQVRASSQLCKSNPGRSPTQSQGVSSLELVVRAAQITAPSLKPDKQFLGIPNCQYNNPATQSHKQLNGFVYLNSCFYIPHSNFLCI